MSIIVLAVPAILIFSVFALIFGITKTKKEGLSDSEESGEMFRSFYLYLVLFATLMMSIGGSVSVFMNVADYVSPVTYEQTFEDYKMYANEGVEVKKNTDELRVTYDAMVVQEEENEKQYALNGIIKSLGWIFIPFPIFLFFQKQSRKEKKTTEKLAE